MDTTSIAICCLAAATACLIIKRRRDAENAQKDEDKKDKEV